MVALLKIGIPEQFDWVYQNTNSCLLLGLLPLALRLSLRMKHHMWRFFINILDISLHTYLICYSYCLLVFGVIRIFRLQFFFITLLLVPISEKMDIDCEARDLADEGLYVGRKPLVMAKERCKMENRLIKEPDGQVWILRSITLRLI